MSDTIAAIATPLGESAIGIIRLSGPDAHALSLRVFTPARQNAAFRSHTLVLGSIVSPDHGPVDQALCVHMRAPRTYTGEDMAELHVHGGAQNVRMALSLCLRAGARLAEPGEFTRRALLAGKLDIAQAEATARLIAARTARQARVAASQLGGAFSTALRALRGEVLAVLAAIEACIDFPDEIDEADETAALLPRLGSIQARMDEALAASRHGRILSSGARVALCGLPNAGKSTLFNALLGHDRAIVTEYAGTTRDTLEGDAQIDGVPVKWIDMAGLREAADPIERIGVARARAEARAADLVLWIVEPGAQTAEEAAEWAALRAAVDAPVLVVRSKLDDAGGEGAGAVEKDNNASFEESRYPGEIWVSAHTGEGMDALRRRIADALGVLRAEPDLLLTEERHVANMRDARDAVGEAIAGLERGEALDIAAVPIHRAAQALAECTGEEMREAVLDEIFKRFCVGK